MVRGLLGARIMPAPSRPLLACLSILAASFPARIHAQTYDPPAAYYASATGTGATLRAQLHAIIDGHTSLSYGAVWNALRNLDADPARSGYVLLLYSGESRDSALQDPGNDNDNWWNREHLWPLSLGPGSTSTTAGTDLHHLFAADKTVNAARGNLPFSTVSGGSTHPEAPGNRYTASAWEPRDADKGRIARVLFYMAIRYEPGDDVGSVGDLELAESTSSTRMARLSTLLEWNRRFPIDDIERRRNDLIHDTYQHNRNPFVDDPYFADRVFADTTARGAWRFQKFTSAQLASAALSGDDADPDGDGLPNLLEYALNLAPLAPDGATPSAHPSATPVTLGSGEPGLAFAYRRNRHAADLAYTIEVSTDLESWSTAAPVSTTTSRADLLTDLVTARIASQGAGTFLRLRVGIRP